MVKELLINTIKTTTFVICALFIQSVHSQNTVEISVPFSDGAIGVVGNNTQNNDNISYFSSLKISKVIFSQSVSNTTNPQFVAQGNDIIGNLTFVMDNQKRVTFESYLVWEDKVGGTPVIYGFNPAPTVSFNLSSYDSTVNYQITGGGDAGDTNISVKRNDRSYTFPAEGSAITGDAATKGLLDDMNAYLSAIESLKPTGPITVDTQVTTDTTPTVTGTASISTSTEQLEIVIDGVTYSWDASNTTEMTYNSTTDKWSIEITTAKDYDKYDVDAYITNDGGYLLKDSTSGELTITEDSDTTAPTMSD